MKDEMHDLVTGFVLGELTDGEAAAFRSHLEGCEECKVEVENLRRVAIDLALEQATEPPAHLRAKVLAAVTRISQDAVSDGPDLAPVIPIRSRPRWIAGGIAAAVVAIALLGWSMLGSGRLMQAVLDDPSAVRIEATAVTGEFEQAEVVFSEAHNAAVLVVDGLVQLPADRIYELWVIDGEEVLAAGLFNTGDGGSASVLVEGDIRPGMVVALTEEPAGGVPVATGEILFTAPVDA
jgi:anti-sigma factor RsiW